MRDKKDRKIVQIRNRLDTTANQYYMSTGHRLCPIIMKLALYDLQTMPNKHVKQLFQFLNRLAVKANQTCRQSLAAMLKVVHINITYQQATNYVQSS